MLIEGVCYTSDVQLVFPTKGFNDILNITESVQEAMGTALTKSSGRTTKEGVAHLFVSGSTAALTAIEYEPGALADLKRALEQIAPMEAKYQHNEAWGDGNGYAHLRAALLKPDLCVPYTDGRLALGAWQQIVLIDFDNRPRRRAVYLTLTPALHS